MESNLLGSKSTHEVLYRILLCETGLFQSPPATLSRQYNAIISVFGDVQTSVMSNSWDNEHAFFIKLSEKISLTRQRDAELFTKLYTSINKSVKLGLDDETIMRQAVYPLIAEMIGRNPQLKHVLKNDIETYTNQHNFAVRKRIYDTLSMMKISL